jgi:hypothetical protein
LVGAGQFDVEATGKNMAELIPSGVNWAEALFKISPIWLARNRPD